MTLSPSSRLQPGETFGRYRLLDPLGEGGMATVFRAERVGVEGFSKIVALKVFHLHLTQDPRFSHLFPSEARLGSYLSHPNLVETLDFGEADGRLFLAMEFVHGTTLEHVLRCHQRLRRPIPLQASLQILAQICHGLQHAHAATDRHGQPLRLVHRDMKPSNVLIGLDGQAKLADFGVARAESNLFQTVHSGLLKGTIQYMSPEQAWGKRTLDHRSDLFSVGMVLFELLTLEQLYGAESQQALLRMAQDAPIEARLAVLPAMPERDALLNTLRRALAASVEARHPSALALAGELETILGRLEPWSTAAFQGWLNGLLSGTPPATSHNLADQAEVATGKPIPLTDRLPSPGLTELPTHVSPDRGPKPVLFPLFPVVPLQPAPEAAPHPPQAVPAASSPQAPFSPSPLEVVEPTERQPERPLTLLSPPQVPSAFPPAAPGLEVARSWGSEPEPSGSSGGQPHGGGTFTSTQGPVELPAQLEPGLAAAQQAPATRPAEASRDRRLLLPLGFLALLGLVLLGWRFQGPILTLLLGSSWDVVQLRVTSDPPGALIRLESGQELGHSPLRVPLHLDGAGLVGLHASLEGYEPQGPVRQTPQAGGELTYHFVLQPAGTAFHLTSIPAGAKADVDGVPRGQTPLELQGLEPGRPHRYTLSLAGYLTATGTLEVGEKGEGSLEVPLSRRSRGARAASSPRLAEASAPSAEAEAVVGASEGYLVVTSSPRAEVLVDGRRLGVSGTGLRMRVSAGTHNVTLRSETDGQKVTRSVTVRVDEIQQVEYDFGSLRWQVKPYRPF